MRRYSLVVLGLASAAAVDACAPGGPGPDEPSARGAAATSRSALGSSPPPVRAVPLQLEHAIAVDAMLLRLQGTSVPTGSTLEVSDQRPSFTPGLTNVRARHLHHGIEVVGDEVIFGVRDGLVVSAIARLTPELPSVVTNRTVADAAAAAQTLAAPLGRDPVATCALVLARPRARPTASPVLRFRCHVRVDAPRAYSEVVLDASSLAVEYIHGTALDAFVPTTAHGDTAYDLTNVTFDAEVDDATNTYRMFSSRLRTWDNLGGTDFAMAEPIRSSGDLFDGLIASLGVSVHWGAERAFDTHQSRFGLDTVDRMRLRVARPEFDQVVNFGANTAYTVREEARIRYGRLAGDHYTHIDVVGHELGHAAVIYSLPVGAMTASFEHTEYGAIMESIADMFGELTERDAMQGNDWIVGGRLPPTIKERNLREPSLSRPPQPDVYLHGAWIDTASTTDHGGVHINDSIGNLWFMRMAFGSPLTQNSHWTSFEVSPIGLEAASKIVLKSVVEKLALLGSYPDLRVASEVAIDEMCGSFSNEAQTSRDAWDAVEVPAYSPPAAAETFSPQDGATDVSPWPARLSWEANGQARWELHLSTNPSFTNHQIHVVTSSEVVAGVTFGYVELELEPNTEYYWRVRWLDRDPGVECWREAHRLTTAANVPQPLSPLGGQHHPWLLEFSYSPVAGATHYDIDVVKQGVGSIFLTPARVPSDVPPGPNMEPRATGEITVRKADKLEWRVRAVHSPSEGSEYMSDWSAPVEFFTNDPQPQTNNPIHNSIQYPWNLDYDWDDLRGATEYDGEIWENPTNSLVGHFAVGAPYLQARRSWSAYQDFEHRWRLKAKGPPLGYAASPEAPETAEESQWSTEKDYVFDFAATRVRISYPQWDPVVRGCYDVGGSPPPITFDPIPHATEIQFNYSALRLQHDANGPPSFWWNSNEVVATVHIPGTQAQGSDGPTERVPRTEGYAVWAVARGPEGAWGAVPEPTDVGMYGLTPPKPRVLNPDLFTGWSPGWVHMLWESDYATKGQFRVEIYANGNCAGAPDSTHVVQMNVDGGNAFEVDKGFGTFSYRVRPAFDKICSKTALQWSACRAHEVAPPPPPPPPTGILVMYDRVRIASWISVPTGQLHIMFAAVAGANVYNAEVRRIGTSSVMGFGFGEGALVSQKNQIQTLYCGAYPDDAACGPNPQPFFPGFLFAATNGAPVASYEVRMKSCRDSNCGAWSDWHDAI